MKSLLLLSVFILLGHSSYGQASDKLTIMTKWVKDIGDSEVSDSTYTVVTDKYFEVDLISLVDEELGFIAKKNLIMPNINKTFEFKYLNVINSDHTDLYFKSKSDLLNHMDRCGYKVQYQQWNEFGANYIFERKE